MVEIDDPVTSGQMQSLARAFNDRLRLVGDLPWRVAWYWHNLWRQVRNPDESGFMFPPQAEWASIYAHINPDRVSIQWPMAGPGEPEGANLGNPMMGFVYGFEGGPDDEPTRITLPMGNPTEPREIWALGKAQRGGYDPVTGAQNAPAFDSALTLFAFGFQPYVPHHKAYGGWQPTPEELAPDCGPGGDPGEGIPNRQVFFTALKKSPRRGATHGSVSTNAGGFEVVTYAGTCPCGTADSVAGHVQYIVRHPLYYLIYVTRGDAECRFDVDFLSTRDWIEGPYEGEPVLTHTDGGQLHRSAWAFHTDFRGSAAQRAGDDWLPTDVGFDNQDFFRFQYPLAPARGRTIAGMLQVDYPKAQLVCDSSRLIVAGSVGEFAPGRTEYRTADSFVMAGFLATSSGLQAPVVWEVLDGDTRIAGGALQPDKPDVVRWFATAAPVTRLRFRLVTDAAFEAAGGSITFEFAEILLWQPYYWDAMLCSRNAGSQGGETMAAGVDGRGVDCEIAQDIVKGLHATGCLRNPGATVPRPQADWVNDNPFYDAARRLTRDHIRYADRRQLVGYEVTGGKSILYFRRFAYGMRNSLLDMWDGIAPPLDPVGSNELVAGETYIVRGSSGSVTYRGGPVKIGQTFKAGTVSEFAAHGDCQVFVYDGIRHRALKQGSTNEWLCLLETRCYHPSASSQWKPEAYSDYFAFNNRCLFYAYTAPPSVVRHVGWNYGVSIRPNNGMQILPMDLQAELFAPEAPTGYNFARGSNRLFATENYCRACRIYESPAEIESCTVDDAGPDQIIRVVLTGRLRSHPDAPASVARDVGSWSVGEVTALRAETYRTDDNAVREYLRHQYDGSYHCSVKEGDSGLNSSVWGLPDNPFGSCYPSFHFVRLIPEPWDDGNDDADDADTRCNAQTFLQMETTLRAICEAFADGRTSAEIVCRSGAGGLYDYTYENLCHEAFGGRWIGGFSAAVRPDNEPGFGPLPNSVMYAEVFNRFARAVNLLTRIRVDLPTVISFRLHDATASTNVDILPVGASCSLSGHVAAWADHVTPPAATALSAGPWDVGTGFTVTQTAGLTGCPFQLTTTRTDGEWKVEVDTLFENALPEWLASLITDQKVALMARLVSTTTRYARQVAPSMADGDGCCDAANLPCPGHWSDAGVYFRWQLHEQVATDCLLASAGVISAGLPPVGDVNLGRDADMPADVWCGAASGRRIEVLFYPDTMAVEIPLV